MDGKVIIGNEFINLENIVGATYHDNGTLELQTVDERLRIKVTGIKATVLWGHLRKHSYVLVLEEKE